MNEREFYTDPAELAMGFLYDDFMWIPKEAEEMTKDGI